MQQQENVSMLNENVYIEPKDDDYTSFLPKLFSILFFLYAAFLLSVNLVITSNIRTLTPVLHDWSVAVDITLLVLSAILCVYALIAYFVKRKGMETRFKGHPIIALLLSFFITAVGMELNICNSAENQGIVPCIPAYSLLFSLFNIFSLGVAIFLKSKKLIGRKFVKSNIKSDDVL